MILLLLVLLPFNAVFAAPASAQKEAAFFEKLKNNIVKCVLCPRECVISQGKRGYCRVRENKGGTLYALSFSKPVAIHVDPIEKKPFFHYLPGSHAFSVATAGCNLNCKFCQNWEISQAGPEDVRYREYDPPGIVREAKISGAGIIAYTYTEPTVFFEYMLETARIARESGIRNVMHSNGFINEAPLRELCGYLDAVNIDLKGFSDEYYARICEGSLAPVLRTLRVLREEGVHVEITNLVLSGYNDDPAVVKKMCEWIRDNLGNDTPLHFSRFFPMYKLLSLIPTPADRLENLRKIALETGLKYVYIGNIPGHSAENTYCPKCRERVIERSGYSLLSIDLVEGKCRFCGEKIGGVWR